ncbi:MAG: phenylalanine--tRNA ligase subunit beta [Candidatus Cloacimonadota bacterium]|nr:MAG: phenylalanine--tRNA ligase subunit beta [Candidatus Cloacimonadota bacterium]
MKITHNWLKELIDIDLEPAKVDEVLTDLGLEVESVTKTLANFDKVIVGKIININKHPEADRLNICEVDINQESPLSIVCGAPNVQINALVPVALMGANLPFGKLKPRKIRGIDSDGMICAEEELGFTDKSDGIWILDNKYKVGTNFRDYFDNDFIYEFSIGPNRPDCFGLKGIVRDLAAKLNTDYQFTTPNLVEKKLTDFQINIEDKEACPRYVGSYIKNVQIKESPEWLKQRLTHIGLRPINNIVDISNYLMYLWGHPMHAFDANQIEGNQIIVRRAKNGEQLTMLDDSIKKLTELDLVICDSNKPTALAGVMGGQNSEITNSTVDVFLEVAYFEPITIRTMSKRHKLHTDASHRFERGMDPLTPPELMKHFVSMVLELAGGTFEGTLDNNPSTFENLEINFNSSIIDRILGINIPNEKISKYLELLGCKLKDTENGFLVTIPSWRPDLERPIDIVEEVARLYGLNEIPYEAPKISLDLYNDKPFETIINKTKSFLVAEGLSECITYSFSSEDSENAISLINPMANDMAQLRTNLSDRIIPIIVNNFKKQNDSLGLFEIGKVFFKENYSEEIHLSIALYNFQDSNWRDNSTQSDFFTLKGILEKMSSALSINLQLKSPKDEIKNCVKDSTMAIFYQGKQIGYLGTINPSVIKPHKMFQTLICLELNLDPILNKKDKTVQFKELSSISSSEKKLALITPKNIAADTILKEIKSLKVSNLESYSIFDLYLGKGIPDDSKSLGIKFIFRGKEKSIPEEEMGQSINKILERLNSKHNITLRP